MVNHVGGLESERRGEVAWLLVTGAGWAWPLPSPGRCGTTGLQLKAHLPIGGPWGTYCASPRGPEGGSWAVKLRPARRAPGPLISAHPRKAPPQGAASNRAPGRRPCQWTARLRGTLPKRPRPALRAPGRDLEHQETPGGPDTWASRPGLPESGSRGLVWGQRRRSQTFPP